MITSALALAATLAFSPVTGPTGEAGCARLGGTSVHYYPVSDRTILISAGVHAYRVETTPSSLLGDPSAIVSTRFRNSNVVCSPVDLSLQVVSPSGRSGLIVQSITPLSRAEAEDLRRGGPRRRRG